MGTYGTAQSENRPGPLTLFGRSSVAGCQQCGKRSSAIITRFHELGLLDGKTRQLASYDLFRKIVMRRFDRSWADHPHGQREFEARASRVQACSEEVRC